MSQESSIQLFENAKIRVIWDDEMEKYFFSVVDVIQVLTESSVAKRYWTDLKRRLKAEGADETYAKIVRLKMPAPDGKMRDTDAADLGLQSREWMRPSSFLLPGIFPKSPARISSRTASSELCTPKPS